ncbi:MAG: hypothetical protein AAF515_18965 [Pseudomonadota bacterium]
MHSFALSLVAALGVWLVLPNPVLLAFAVTMLAAAHSRPGTAELMSGYVYPAITVLAALTLVVAWRRRQAADRSKQSSTP